MQKLCTAQNVNCRDLEGRLSTPLHFAAGYNKVAVVEYLLKHGADVHAKDKGGLVPLHNACSYGHYEVRRELISETVGLIGQVLVRKLLSTPEKIYYF